MPKRSPGARCTELRRLLPALLLTGSAAGATDADFTACIARLGDTAREAGVSERVVREVLGQVEPVERVIELDRKQPEFTRTFADYYLARVTDERVARGRELLAEHRDLLERITRETGVPPQYLVAFWGLETNFGSYFGNIPVPNALATLACDERRSEFFSAELIAALKILDMGEIEPGDMVGSWAGAMGHMQFLPSVYIAYATDGDGDGRRDVWGSVADALISAGRYLESEGWQTGLRWGRQVTLPDGFDFSLAGRDLRKPLREWVDLGVTTAYGATMPRLDLPASILVPAGHDGPAFIAYENFDVIMRWNRSEHYALSVGRLADRIAGDGALEAPLDRIPPPVSTDDARKLQEALAELGYDPGKIDGVPGPATRRALSRFQQDRKLVADGHVDAEALAAVTEAMKTD